jgi:hypothetical protein
MPLPSFTRTSVQCVILVLFKILYLKPTGLPPFNFKCFIFYFAALHKRIPLQSLTRELLQGLEFNLSAKPCTLNPVPNLRYSD